MLAALDGLTALMDRAYRLLRTVLVLLLAGYLTLVLLQVFFRYVLNESLFWAEELVRFSLVWSVLLGSALVARDRAHIRIDIFENLLPPSWRRGLNLVLDLLMILFCVILAVTGLQFVGRSLMQTSPSLNVPMWTVYAAVPVGAALQAVFVLSVLRRPTPPHGMTEPGEPV